MNKKASTENKNQYQIDDSILVKGITYPLKVHHITEDVLGLVTYHCSDFNSEVIEWYIPENDVISLYNPKVANWIKDVETMPEYLPVKVVFKHNPYKVHIGYKFKNTVFIPKINYFNIETPYHDVSDILFWNFIDGYDYDYLE